MQILNLLYNSQSAKLVGKENIIKDYTLGLLYGILIFLLIWKLTENYKKERVIILLSWIIRIFISMVFLTFLVENHYMGSNDAITHYKIALHMDNMFFNFVGGTYNFRVLLHFILQITFHSFHAAKITISFIGFLGSWFFFLSFYSFYKDSKYKRIMAFLIFNWPSVLFWTSNLYKDGLNFYFLGASTYLISLIFQNNLRWRHSLVILSLIPAFLIRPLGVILYIVAFSITTGIFLFCKEYKIPNYKKIFYLIFIVGSFIIIFKFLQTYFHVNFFKDNLYFLVNYYYHRRIPITIITSTIITSTIINPWGRILFIYETITNKEISHFLYKFFNYIWPKHVIIKMLSTSYIIKLYLPLLFLSFINFFRPFPWEIRNLYMLIASIEGSINFMLTGWLLLKVRTSKHKGILKDKLQIFFIIYIFLWFATAGILSSWNLGLFARYRIQIILPYLFILYRVIL